MSPIELANLVKHEFIGLEVRVSASSQPSLNLFAGSVLDETMKTLTISSESCRRVVAKRDCTFSFRLPGDHEIEVNGNAIIGRPEDRVKKRSRESEERVHVHWKR